MVSLNELGPKIEILANVAIVVVAVTLTVVIYQNHYRPQIHSSQPEIELGASIPLKNVNWTASDFTLVLALSTRCHFCTESAPFYQELVSRISGSQKIHMTAIFPQSTSEGREYLQTLGIGITDIQQHELSSIPVAGTPTLLLVDRQGRLIQKWRGKLKPQHQADILQRLGL